MKLSLSGRLVESGKETILPVREFLVLAKRHGYAAVDLRATQLGPTTTDADFAALKAALKETGLAVFEGAFGGKLDAAGEKALTEFASRLASLGAKGLRMGGDLATLKRACQVVAPFHLQILYQMHTNSPFETIASTAKAIAEIAEPNFAVMPEPANLLMAREKFTPDMFAPLRGRIGGVHVQTLEVRPDAKNVLKLTDGTEVRYDRVEYADNRQTDFATFFQALKRAGFDGFVNELEPCPGKEKVEETVANAAAFLARFVK
ncbi:MAG: hypothetical protein A3K19_26850 [Lentisphaerae bacterium RIFOXYB12_FULL_65_16]|nr:MAG: hypothetical protein A3K18_23825 [Lentisphaerae bacterium RIFOXYA12_64_32]OGV88018.1 MAG: hypothetical protein A3K19_26850 [Lentisphaerae bacterium RIFOXYB12_FULL_65_16]